jgi:hypothetical protein
VTPETGLVHPLADLLLDFVDGVLKAFGDGVTAQGLDVEAVGGRWEDEEGHDLKEFLTRFLSGCNENAACWSNNRLSTPSLRVRTKPPLIPGRTYAIYRSLKWYKFLKRQNLFFVPSNIGCLD